VASRISSGRNFNNTGLYERSTTSRLIFLIGGCRLCRLTLVCYFDVLFVECIGAAHRLAQPASRVPQAWCLAGRNDFQSKPSMLSGLLARTLTCCVIRAGITTGCYFHSQSVERLFPSASTSYSKIAATLFSRDHLGDELW
jgi:hypothetical protein